MEISVRVKEKHPWDDRNSLAAILPELKDKSQRGQRERVLLS